MNDQTAVPGFIRPADVLGFSFSALGQQKVRSLLTLAGVVIGTFALAVSLAIGRGVDRAILALFQEDDRIRKVLVYPRYEPDSSNMPAAEREPKGTMSEAKRERLRKVIVENWGRTHGFSRKVPLTPARMDELARLEHVQAVEPVVFLGTRAEYQGKKEQVTAVSAHNAGRLLQHRLIAGHFPNATEPRGAIVDEFLLYRWGIITDEEVSAVIGRSFRLESPAAGDSGVPSLALIGSRLLSLGKEDAAVLERALRHLVVLVRFLPLKREERDLLTRLLTGPEESPKDKPPAPFVEEFTIVGAVRRWAEDDPKPPPNNWGIRDADIYLPTQSAVGLYLRLAQAAKEGFSQVELTVDDVAHVKEVAKKVEALGHNEYSFAEVIGTIRMNVMMVTFGMAFVACVALSVAGLGITNTMIMSVLERTHEIGIMKALGARTGTLRMIFLIEGGVLGLCGGLLGLGLAYLVSFPGDSIARSIMEPQTQTPVKESLFFYPLWLVLGTPALATLITTLAAVYPAHRASAVDPITSLRHE
jgi:putative ABC transport system permease protein